MNREVAQALGKHFLAIGDILMRWDSETSPEEKFKDSLKDLCEFQAPSIFHPPHIRGTVEGTVKHGRLVDVQVPIKGGKSTKVLIADEHGTSFTAYAGTFAFDPEDLLQYEGYDIYYTVKEIEKGDSRFTALASWQPLT